MVYMCVTYTMVIDDKLIHGASWDAGITPKEAIGSIVARLMQQGTNLSIDNIVDLTEDALTFAKLYNKHKLSGELNGKQE